MLDASSQSNNINATELLVWGEVGVVKLISQAKGGRGLSSNPGALD
jgi:hypothetical protein